MPGRVEDVRREAERVVIKVVVIDVSRISVGPGVAAGIVVRITEADLLAVAEIGIDLPVALDPGIAAGTRIKPESPLPAASQFWIRPWSSTKVRTPYSPP